MSSERLAVIKLLDAAVASGARLSKACSLLGLSVRTLQRWRTQGPQGFDARMGPKTAPGNKLSAAQRQRVLAVANEPAHRDLSPEELVPRLADQGRYLASESTIYRILREEKALNHRQPSRPPTVTRPREHQATGPGEVLSWDITYLRSLLRGAFYYLYLIEDIWSRRIVGWTVQETESMDHASQLIDATAAALGRDPRGMVLHSDNGSPMKGSTMLATLQRLGIVPSFSRPRVSDDNAYSEPLFRTLKYRPSYPSEPFKDLTAARAWVADFVIWYNTEHLHGGIGYVTPQDGHGGKDIDILAARRRVYENARRQTPERWSGQPRSWGRPDVVRLNPAGDRTAA